MVPRSVSVVISFFLLAGVLAGWPALAQSPIVLEKATNGIDADVPPGPAIAVGDPVTWTYEVTNAGSRNLTNVTVTDDQGVVVTCPGSALGPGQSMTCTGSDTAVLGQYANLGTASGELPNESVVSDSDPSHYSGQAELFVELEKATNGIDADSPPGPLLGVGSTVTFTYEVTNVGSQALSNVTVTDDQGVVVTCPGDSLGVGESMTCTATDVVVGGAYANLGTVEATLPDTTTVEDSDPSHHFGHELFVEKATDGVDADSPPGPTLTAGDPVTWTYEVTNPGPATVTDLAVTDDQGVAVSCPTTTLVGRESVTCTGSGLVVPGSYANVGTATALLPSGFAVSASDPSHYFAEEPAGLAATKVGFLADDVNGDGLAGPGDTLRYEVTVTHLGDLPAEDVVFTDTPDPATSLVVGSVGTTAGVVTVGNQAGDGSVAVDLGTLGGGAVETIVYDVVLDVPLPDDLEQVVNQGILSASNVDDVATDDPGTAEPGDATAIAVVAVVPPEIPVLGGGGLLALLALLGALGWRRLGG